MKILIAPFLLYLSIAVLFSNDLIRNKKYHGVNINLKESDLGKELRCIHDFANIIRNCNYEVFIVGGCDLCADSKTNKRLIYSEGEINLGYELDNAALFFNARYSISENGKITFTLAPQKNKKLTK